MSTLVTTRLIRISTFALALCLLALMFGAAPAPAVHASMLVVTSSADGNATPANCPGPACRLRDAIAAANAEDTITFSFTGVILLSNGSLLVDKNLTILASGAA